MAWAGECVRVRVELRPWRPNLLLELVDVLQGVGAADDGEVDVE